VPGDLGWESLGAALQAPESLDDDLVDLVLGTVFAREAEGVGAALHLDEIALARKADVAVAQLVAVPDHQVVPGGPAMLVAGEGEDEVGAGPGTTFVALVHFGARVVPRSSEGAFLGLAGLRILAEVTGEDD
jgi:hypothetical protein